MDKPTAIAKLRDLGACRDALGWLENIGAEDAAAAWNACDAPSWLLWLASRTILDWQDRLDPFAAELLRQASTSLLEGIAVYDLDSLFPGPMTSKIESGSAVPADFYAVAGVMGRFDSQRQRIANAAAFASIWLDPRFWCYRCHRHERDADYLLANAMVVFGFAALPVEFRKCFPAQLIVDALSLVSTTETAPA